MQHTMYQCRFLFFNSVQGRGSFLNPVPPPSSQVLEACKTIYNVQGSLHMSSGQLTLKLFITSRQLQKLYFSILEIWLELAFKPIQVHSPASAVPCAAVLLLSSCIPLGGGMEGWGHTQSSHEAQHAWHAERLSQVGIWVDPDNISDTYVLHVNVKAHHFAVVHMC